MKKFYVTTPIYYVNGKASIGHAYTNILSDVIARWKRLNCYDVFFLTGTDENASKTVEGAKTAGYTDIKKYADDMAEMWKDLWKKLGLSNNDFIRTTEDRHKKIVLSFFKKCYKNGDVYKGKYSGLYCDGCEGFVMEKDLVDKKCPFHLKEPRQIEEENYFFRLSNYQEKLIEYIERNHDFIGPEARRNEVIAFLRAGLKDISISRPNIEWGIKFPIDKGHTFWVWFDALLNYVSGAPKKYWPADLHLMAKDILKFHAIYWPAMLMSAGYKLPKKVYAHGFMTVNGQKMSKSLGNVIDPLYLKDKYGVDSIRYYLVRAIPFGEDGDFSEKALVDRHNNELANDLGNLLSRVLTLAEKNFEVVKKSSLDRDLKSKLDLKQIKQHMDCYELHNAISEIWKFVNEANRYVNEKRPWELKGKKLERCIYNLLESIRVVSILLSPFMPGTAEKINSQLNVENGSLKECKFGLVNEYSVRKGEILFKKI